MTEVQVFKHNGNYSSFICSGHTGYAESGSDIVCAGVSAIVINTINCLTDLLDTELSVDYSEDDGEIICNLPAVPTEKETLLIDCMLHGLEWIVSQYGNDYLNYEIKEV